MLGEKQSGLIVDYVGVFKDLERALAIYGSGTGGASGEDETPIKAKQNLLQDLARAADEVTVFLGEQGIEPQRIMASGGFDRLLLLDDAREVLARTEESKSRFLSLSRPVFRLYQAVLLDTRAAESAPLVKMLSVMVERLRQLDPEIDISVVMADVQRVLDQSITARSFVIEEAGDEEPVDLSRLDFDDLRRKFEEGRKGTEAERLKGRVN